MGLWDQDVEQGQRDQDDGDDDHELTIARLPALDGRVASAAGMPEDSFNNNLLLNVLNFNQASDAEANNSQSNATATTNLMMN